jgi:hypothetical protein
MDWEWERVSADGANFDEFVIRIRRSDKPGDDRKSLTFIDRPHNGSETVDRSVFPDLDSVFAITGPLFKELRADGWTLMRTIHRDEVKHHAKRATV